MTWFTGETFVGQFQTNWSELEPSTLNQYSSASYKPTVLNLHPQPSINIRRPVSCPLVVSTPLSPVTRHEHLCVSSIIRLGRILCKVYAYMGFIPSVSLLHSPWPALGEAVLILSAPFPYSFCSILLPTAQPRRLSQSAEDSCAILAKSASSSSLLSSQVLDGPCALS